MKGRRIVAVVMLLIMMVSGAMEIQAASGKIVRLFGIHETDNGVDLGHSLMCNWLETAKYYKRADSTVDMDKRHHATAESIHGTLTRANYMLIATHGGVYGIKGYNDTSLHIDSIKKGKRMDQLGVCFVGSCWSLNTAEAIHDMGAETTIGYRTKVAIESNALMLRHFNLHFAAGESVDLSLFNSKSDMIRKGKPLGDTQNYNIYGNKLKKFLR